jgi:hypothetical protein
LKTPPGTFVGEKTPFVATYNTSGLLGSIDSACTAVDVNPVFMNVQVAPPSVVLYTPLAGVELKVDDAATHMVLTSVGCSTTSPSPQQHRFPLPVLIEIGENVAP